MRRVLAVDDDPSILAVIKDILYRVAERLQLNVTLVANADRFDYATTVIIDYTGKPYTAKWLSDTFHISSSSILSGNNPSSEVDVRIILGADFILPSQ